MENLIDAYKVRETFLDVRTPGEALDFLNFTGHFQHLRERALLFELPRILVREEVERRSIANQHVVAFWREREKTISRGMAVAVSLPASGVKAPVAPTPAAGDSRKLFS